MSLEADAFGDVWISSMGLGVLRFDSKTLTVKQQYLAFEPGKPALNDYFFSFKAYDEQTMFDGALSLEKAINYKK